MHNSFNSSLKKSVTEIGKHIVSGHAAIAAVVFAISGLFTSGAFAVDLDEKVLAIAEQVHTEIGRAHV